MVKKLSEIIMSRYPNKFRVHSHPGLWRFIDWLPCEKPLNTKSGAITFLANGIGNELGLKNVYVAFCGYSPNRNANNMTASFKDLEASPTVSEMLEKRKNSIVVASAGNTAKAFAYMSTLVDFEVHLFVPKTCLDLAWLPVEANNRIHLYSVDGDYYDAIEYAKKFANYNNIPYEGGASNNARRDGMGTVLCEFVAENGVIPKHYFQAVGSGTGAIAQWEMNQRFNDIGFKGKMKLHIGQSEPFIPIINAWKKRSPTLNPLDLDKEKEKGVFSRVLTNRNPPYSVKGGLYDALEDTDGKAYAISEKEAISSKATFERIMQIDIMRPSAIAFASLVKAVEEGNVDRNDKILLNITGGGVEQLQKDYGKHMIPVKKEVIL